jgi:hypothetical protein
MATITTKLAINVQVAGTTKKYKNPIMVNPIKQVSIAHNKLRIDPLKSNL